MVHKYLIPRMWDFNRLSSQTNDRVVNMQCSKSHITDFQRDFDFIEFSSFLAHLHFIRLLNYKWCQHKTSAIDRSNTIKIDEPEIYKRHWLWDSHIHRWSALNSLKLKSWRSLDTCVYDIYTIYHVECMRASTKPNSQITHNEHGTQHYHNWNEMNRREKTKTKHSIHGLFEFWASKFAAGQLEAKIHIYKTTLK